MKVKLYIKNETGYSTRDMRKLILLCIKYFNGWLGKHRPVNYMTVQLVYKRTNLQGGIIGRATYGSKHGGSSGNGRWMQLYLYKDVKKFSIESVAETVVHELEHLVGRRHNEMIENYDVRFLDGFEIHYKDPVIKNKPERGTSEYYDDKLIKLFNRKKTWITKRRRAKNAIINIDKKIRYNEKQLAARTNQKEVGSNKKAGQPYPA